MTTNFLAIVLGYIIFTCIIVMNVMSYMFKTFRKEEIETTGSSNIPFWLGVVFYVFGLIGALILGQILTFVVL
jgi:hypothetical protein